MLKKQILGTENGSCIINGRKGLRRSPRVKDTKMKMDKQQKSVRFIDSNDSDSDDGSATEYNPDDDEGGLSNNTPDGSSKDTDSSEKKVEYVKYALCHSVKKKRGMSPRTRDTFSPPQRVTDVRKHKQMTRKFEVVARTLAEFQIATTWSEPRDQKEKPKCQFFLVAYDELVPQPTKWPILD